jgi:tetratricopeptide (TPR) repeat protein
VIREDIVYTFRLLTLFLAVTLLAACQTLSGSSDLPQRSDLFQLSNEALLAYEAGEDTQAEKLYMALLRKTPNDPEIWFRLGNLYARAHRPDAAADAYQRVLSINGNEPRAWYNLGIVRLRQGWAAMIQANDKTNADNPLFLESEKLIRHLEKTPGLPISPNESPPNELPPKK